MGSGGDHGEIMWHNEMLDWKTCRGWSKERGVNAGYKKENKATREQSQPVLAPIVRLQSMLNVVWKNPRSSEG